MKSSSTCLKCMNNEKDSRKILNKEMHIRVRNVRKTDKVTHIMVVPVFIIFYRSFYGVKLIFD